MFYVCALVLETAKRYPDKWIDYERLKIDDGDSFLEMVFKAREFENLRETEEMNAPTDKEKWVSSRFTITCRRILDAALVLKDSFPCCLVNDTSNN